MIEARSLGKTYGESVAVRGVDFTIHPGEVVGLLGPNGAGKTTIMKILTAYHFPSSGSVHIFGHDVYSDECAIKAILGYLPENAPHYPEFKVTEYLDFVADVRIGKGRTPSGLNAKEAVQKALVDCALTDVQHKLIDELSKGYRQRLGLAQAILHEPQLLILDEPTTGLDPNQILEIRRLIRTLREGRTIILSTHILQEVEAVCDRVLIIHKGEIVAQGKTQEIADDLRGETLFELAIAGAGSATRALLEPMPGVQRVEEDSLIISALGEVPEGTELHGFRVRLKHDAGASWQFRTSVSALVHQAGFQLLHMASRTASLEDLFVRLTQGDQGEKLP